MTDERALQLAELLELVRSRAMRIAANRELREPILAVLDEQGETLLFALGVPGVHPSEQAKALIYSTRGVVAAIAFEAWEVELPGTPELHAAHAAGLPLELPHELPPPSEHPDRLDVLMLIGQVRGRPIVERSWQIEDVGGLRVFRVRDRGGVEPQPGRFNPLFVSVGEIRQIVRRVASAARLTDQVRSRTS